LVEHVFDLFHNGRNSSCIVEILGRPFSRRADIQEIMSSSVQSVKSVSVDLNTEFMSYSRKMKKGIGRTGNCRMDHDGIFERFHSHDLVRGEIMKSQPYSLFSRFSGYFS